MRIRIPLTVLVYLGLVLGMLASLPGAQPVVGARAGQTNVLAQADLRPLANLINPDGTLDLTTGFSGALDPTGWRVEYAPDGGPVFRPLDGPAALSSPASTWHALDTGLNGTVHALAVAGSRVYVGGSFTNAGGNGNANRIALWNGSAWYNLGQGVNDKVFAIAVAGSDVYVGGEFTNVSGNADANYIARWNGYYWHALGPGLNKQVRAIAVSGPDVYVGGAFTDADGNADADRIARWDGSAWHALDSGLDDIVLAIAMRLQAGERFRIKIVARDHLVADRAERVALT